MRCEECAPCKAVAEGLQALIQELGGQPGHQLRVDFDVKFALPFAQSLLHVHTHVLADRG